MGSVATLHFLVGPTAVGKTELALQWAEAHGAGILSCDAFCVYEGMDIGTAKPTATEQARVPHYGIDLVSAATPYSVADYLRVAEEAVDNMVSRGQAILVAGGSGFYLKSFFSPVMDKIQVGADVRERVAYIFETGGLAGALEELRTLNPEGLGGLDILNPRRVGRALERSLASGLTLKEQAHEFAAQASPFAAYPKRVCLLERESADLDRRIARRVQSMLDSGLVEEVSRLQNEGLEGNPTASKAIGYRETLRYLSGELAEEALPGAIAQNTRRLVRKQRTWFRTQIPVHQRAHPERVGMADLFTGV